MSRSVNNVELKITMLDSSEQHKFYISQRSVEIDITHLKWKILLLFRGRFIRDNNWYKILLINFYRRYYKKNNFG